MGAGALLPPHWCSASAALRRKFEWPPTGYASHPFPVDNGAGETIKLPRSRHGRHYTGMGAWTDGWLINDHLQVCRALTGDTLAYFESAYFRMCKLRLQGATAAALLASAPRRKEVHAPQQRDSWWEAYIGYVIRDVLGDEKCSALARTEERSLARATARAAIRAARLALDHHHHRNFPSSSALGSYLLDERLVDGKGVWESHSEFYSTSYLMAAAYPYGAPSHMHAHIVCICITDG